MRTQGIEPHVAASTIVHDTITALSLAHGCQYDYMCMRAVVTHVVASTIICACELLYVVAGCDLRGTHN